MEKKRRGSLLPLTYIFGSFIGAAMIAIVFTYNNYRFSRYKFVDFSEMIFYTKSDIFKPKDEKFLLMIFSSNQENVEKIIKNIDINLPIVAVDILQKRQDGNSSLTYMSSDINTILKLINRLNITHIPSALTLDRNNGLIYKQSSAIEKF